MALCPMLKRRGFVVPLFPKLTSRDTLNSTGVGWGAARHHFSRNRFWTDKNRFSGEPDDVVKQSQTFSISENSGPVYLE